MKDEKLRAIFYSLFLLLIVVGTSCFSRNYDQLIHERNKPTLIANSFPVGNQTCIECHDTIRDKKVTRYHSDCEGCHGGGSVHVEGENQQGTIAFPGDQQCMSCHLTGNNIQITWPESQHKRGGITCSHCHTQHTKNKFLLDNRQDIRFKKINRITSLCISCHQEMLARINMPSHHPLKEGSISCTDCHDPHSDNRVVLSENNELCFRCHQDKQGPWVFEHAPVVEDCAHCHEPHGTVNAQLIKLAQPTLCLQCHSIPSNRHGGSAGASIPANYLKRCTNCHGAIHGTHQDRHLRQ